MIRWLMTKLLGTTARAGEQVLDAEQCLAIPPRALASAAPQRARNMSARTHLWVVPSAHLDAEHNPSGLWAVGDQKLTTFRQYDRNFRR